MVSQIFAFPKSHLCNAGLNLLQFNLQLSRAPFTLSIDHCTLATAPTKPLHFRCYHNLPQTLFPHISNYPFPVLLLLHLSSDCLALISKLPWEIKSQLYSRDRYSHSAQISLPLQTGRQAMGERKHPYLDSYSFLHKFFDSSFLPNSKPQTPSAQIDRSVFSPSHTAT